MEVFIYGKSGADNKYSETWAPYTHSTRKIWSEYQDAKSNEHQRPNVFQRSSLASIPRTPVPKYRGSRYQVLPDLPTAKCHQTNKNPSRSSDIEREPKTTSDLVKYPRINIPEYERQVPAYSNCSNITTPANSLLESAMTTSKSTRPNRHTHANVAKTPQPHNTRGTRIHFGYPTCSPSEQTTSPSYLRTAQRAAQRAAQSPLPCHHMPHLVFVPLAAHARPYRPLSPIITSAPRLHLAGNSCSPYRPHSLSSDSAPRLRPADNSYSAVHLRLYYRHMPPLAVVPAFTVLPCVSTEATTQRGR